MPGNECGNSTSRAARCKDLQIFARIYTKVTKGSSGIEISGGSIPRYSDGLASQLLNVSKVRFSNQVKEATIEEVQNGFDGDAYGTGLDHAAHTCCKVNVAGDKSFHPNI